MQKKLIIIGGGAAGMMAACIAAAGQTETILIEKNEKLGKKLYITGKGRCNLTNACDTNDFFNSIVTNPKFMYSSIYGFDQLAVIDFFEALGMKTKIERGNRVFPESDKSSDVIGALKRELNRKGVKVLLNTTVEQIVCEDSEFKKVVLSDSTEIEANGCFVATGGLSYPSTGSTGDGFRFARECGHKVTRLLPSLVAVKVRENFVKELEGLSLKNVVLSAGLDNKIFFSQLGEMLFTHDGISGPLVLTLSALYTDRLASGADIRLHIDLKPGMDEKMLDDRILRDFGENINRKFMNSLNKLLPSTIIPSVIRMTGINPDKQVNLVTKPEREKLIKVIKDFELTALGTGGYSEAIITKGGIDVKQINPSTMESKLVKGLYFIGEVLDVDALTGGYNLQIAWSTAHTAAQAFNESKE